MMAIAMPETERYNNQAASDSVANFRQFAQLFRVATGRLEETQIGRSFQTTCRRRAEPTAPRAWAACSSGVKAPVITTSPPKYRASTAEDRAAAGPRLHPQRRGVHHQIVPLRVTLHQADIQQRIVLRQTERQRIRSRRADRRASGRVTPRRRQRSGNRRPDAAAAHHQRLRPCH